MPVTPGKVHQSPGQIRITRQPYLKNGWIWRRSGVDRKSEKVLKANDNFAEQARGNSMAKECAGKDRPEFFRCLRKKGEELIPDGSVEVS